MAAVFAHGCACAPLLLPFRVGEFGRRDRLLVRRVQRGGHRRQVRGQRAAQKALGLAHGLGHRHEQNRVADEALAFHRAVGRHDDAARLVDLLFGQHVLRAVGAVGLHLDADAHFGGAALERFGRHEGVGDAQRAGRDGQHLIRAAAAVFCRLFLAPAVQRLHEHLRVGRGDELPAAFRLHQAARQPGQHLHMQVGRVGRGGDHEHEPHRRAVRRLPVDAFGQCHGGQGRPGHAAAFGMRDGDAAAHGGAALFLPRKDLLAESFLIFQAAVRCQGVQQRLQRFLFAGGLRTQQDTPRPQQICDAHNARPSQ